MGTVIGSGGGHSDAPTRDANVDVLGTLTVRERRGSARRRRHDRHLADALDGGRRQQLAVIIVAWAAVTAWAWSWWLDPAHGSGSLPFAINTTLIAVETTLLPTWFLWFLWRMKRPDTTIPVPALRAAMVVTKAPSEPWPVVRATLAAMLRQEYPFPYDTWLADEDPDAATRRWCREHGVLISCRKDVAAYHRSTWPRRTRCKEGNLAYFYDRFAYAAYDVVAQLDADHIPEPSYLAHMVRPFTDPHVGYVAAPSICDTNAAQSWAARGRLYAEAVLHGPMQAGHSGGFAPTCVGSHYAVRTQALREIGGLGPELAEDFTTTLMMGARGWQGVFAIDAEAHGAGPATVADCVTQDFQWSRSMMNVLLSAGRPYWRGLSVPAKVRLGFCQLWYPLFAAFMLASILIPVVAILTRTPFVTVSLGGFYAHFVPPILVLLVLILWLRSLTFLRPRTARALSWEMPLFQIVRWPWVLAGCAQAVAGRIAGRDFEFKITPKAREGTAPLPLRTVMPYLLIALVSALPVLFGGDAGAAAGYRTLALLNAGIYVGTALVILALHVHEHPRNLRVAVVRHLRVNVAVTAGVVLVLASAVLHPVSLVEPTTVQARAIPAVRAPVGVPGALTVGVTTEALARNPGRRWTPADLGEVTGFERTTGGHAGIVQWFADWRHSPRVDLEQLQAVAARGSIPQITWEPWDHTVGLHRPQPAYSLRSIAAGAHDAYIRTWARGLRSFGRPVQLRFAHEMNGTHYPWSQSSLGNRRGDHARAWRHVHDVFTAEGATNVRWVWSPLSGHQDDLDYPGDAYVDIVGMSGFNGGSALNWAGWRSFRDIYDGPLKQLHRIAPHKPVQISEVSSAEAGGDKATWILDMFAYLREHPGVRSVLWFDARKQTDWRVDSSLRSAQAFAAGRTIALTHAGRGRDCDHALGSAASPLLPTAFEAAPRTCTEHDGDRVRSGP